MKRFLFITLALFTLSLGVSAQTNEGGKKMKTLVAYFSATGTTEKIAKDLADVVKGDLFKIEPAKPYTTADLNWNDKESRSTVEMADKSSRPAIANKVQNMADYDIVFIGFPIWWYTNPTIINTFMESYDFTGKTVVPFATSGGSNTKKAEADMKKLYPNVHFRQGKLLNDADRNTLINWTSWMNK
ncbi:MAG: flavodoxin [Phocaeicola sp.]|uniref:flavodoxin n=1 Tax=Phocaeicola sp. TaxID=2773926 RepID=UPI003FA0BD8F